MNAKLKLMLLSILTCAAFLQPISAFAERGGVGGGGGDLEPIKLADSAEIENFIKINLLAYLHGFFNNGIANTDDYSVLNISNSIRKKLYDGSETIFDKLNNIPIVTQTEPCVDPKTGEKKDASATPEKVCLSLGRLANRHSLYEYKRYITAISAHEFSHLVDGTEIEAKFIEHYAVTQLHLSNVSYKVSLVRISTSGAQTRIHTSVRPALKLSDVTICLRLLSLQKSLTEMQRNLFGLAETGLSMLNPQESLRLEAIRIKSDNLIAFCQSTAIAQEFVPQQIEDKFLANETEVDLSVYAKRSYYSSRVHPNNLLVIRKLSTGDTAALDSELEEISHLIHSLKWLGIIVDPSMKYFIGLN